MLKTRALSAIVLAPVALLAAWAGGYPFAVLVAVAALLMCWEWTRMAGAGQFGAAGRVSAVGCFVAALTAVDHPQLATALVVAVAFAAAALPGIRRNWTLAGALYAGLPSVALVWLRVGGTDGGAVVWWLLLVVWSTDVGAYAFGRMIGGPLLLPVVSPKKTWAGLLGGMICAGLAGWLVARSFDLGAPLALGVASAVVAVVAQAGDLFESWVKRRWGVKDSSSIIPGHGGVLDRVDGLLAAAAVVALVALVSGHSVLAWP